MNRTGIRRLSGLLALLAALGGPATANAQETPLVLYHGYATDAQGVPTTGSLSVTFSLFDAESGGNEVWTETQSLIADKGNIAAQLGATTPLTAALFGTGALYLGLKVNDEELPGRQPVAWVPLALRSIDSAGLAGKPVVSAGCSAGQALIFGDTGWTCSAPGTSYTGSGGIEVSGTVISLPTGCGTGQLLKWDGTTWTCANDNNTPATVAAGSGLQLSGGDFSLLASCAAGQVLKWNGSQWGCAADANATYAAGSGLALSGNTFSLIGSCSAGQLLKWDGAQWGCASDTDTQIDAAAGGGITRVGTNFQITACGNGQILKYNTATTTWACADDIVGEPQLSYSAGGGLALDMTTFSVMPCLANEHLRWNGTSWACAKDWAGDPIATLYGGLGQDLSAAVTGSMPIATATGVFGLLSPGAEGQVLRIVGGVPAWAAATTGTVQSITAGTGLTGGTITQSGTIAADETYLATLGTAQTITGAKTFQNGTVKMRSAANSASTTLTAANATVDQTISLPNASGTVPVAAAAPLNISPTGTLTVATASATGTGVMQVGSGLSASSGVVSVDYGTGATSAVAGNDNRLPPPPGTTGRILYDTGTAWGTVAPGTAGNFLKSQGAAAPTWQSLQSSDIPSHPHAASDITSGVLGVARGGTGATSVGAAGAVGYSNGTAYTFSSAGTGGQVLKSNGSAAPTWGAVDIGETTGDLAVDRGGTGQTGTFTPGGILYASTSSTMSSTPAGSSGQALGWSGSSPGWVAANAHDHVGQSWSTTSSGSVLSLSTSASTGRALEVVASTTSGVNYALSAQTDSNSGRALYGQVNNTAGADARAVLGETPSTSSGAAAVEGRATGATGDVSGVKGTTSSTAGAGVLGEATATTGAAYGVDGRTASSNGIGVFGLATSSTGTPVGVMGVSDTPGGNGVVGQANTGNGLRGISGSATGIGVYATNTSTSGNAYGVQAQTPSTSGKAVYGIATSASSTNYGVYGSTNSATGYGLYTPQRAFVGRQLSVSGNLTVGSNVSVNATTGQFTATSFSGNGASLTNLGAGNISGTFPLDQGGTGTDLTSAGAGFVKKSTALSTSLTTVSSLSASDIATGVLVPARGGTGVGAVGSAGSVVYSDGAVVSYTAQGTSGRFLQSAGAGQPQFARVDLGDSTEVQGTVDPAHGGLGIDTSATAANAILRTSAIGTWGTLAPGSEGEILTMVSGAPTWSPLTLPDNSITFAKWADNGCKGSQFPVWNGSAWTCGSSTDGTPRGNEISTLDSFNVTGSHPSVRLGVDGLPVIAYVHTTGLPYGFKVLKCTSTDCASGTISFIATGSNSNSYTALAIGSDGNPIVAHQDSTNQDLKIVHCTNPSCTSWDTPVTLDSIGNVGYYNSIAIGIDGNPIVAYYDSTNTSLKVVHCTDTACSTFDSPLVLDGSSSAVGSNCSIAIGVDGLPIISYVRVDSERQVKVVHCTTVSCEADGSPAIDTPVVVENQGGVNIAGGTAISIGLDGFPVFGYYTHTSSGQRYQVAKCTSVDCSTSGFVVVDPATSNAGSIFSSSLSVPKDGLPIITYYQGGGIDDLRFVKCGTPDCSANNTIRTIDSTGRQGLYNSVTIGADGFPFIAYYDWTNSNLKVAKCYNPFCLPYWRRR